MSGASNTSAEYQVKAALDTLEGFAVTGISVVTSKERAAEDINALWERFFSEKVGQLVHDKVSDVIYAVYSDYEGDHEAPYRLSIGYRTQSGAQNNGFHSVLVTGGDYAILSAAGPQPMSLVETWKSVWQSDLDRSYKTDFEVYGPRFFEEGVNEVLIYIGVKA